VAKLLWAQREDPSTRETKGRRALGKKEEGNPIKKKKKKKSGQKMALVHEWKRRKNIKNIVHAKKTKIGGSKSRSWTSRERLYRSPHQKKVSRLTRAAPKKSKP